MCSRPIPVGRLVALREAGFFVTGPLGRCWTGAPRSTTKVSSWASEPAPGRWARGARGAASPPAAQGTGGPGTVY